jgi:LuxR family transcriptional regulator of csgAB operon
MNDVAREFRRSRSVIIIGRQSLQNKLLANLINERLGYVCLVRSVHDNSGLAAQASPLTLVDIEGTATAVEIGSLLELLSASASCGDIAVINAEESLTFEQILSWPGVKGIFFRETSQENLLKGINCIFEGEYWLPRKILSAYLEQFRTRWRPSAPEAAILTRKEMETLKLLTSGSSNIHIAQRLKVSPHTVKTHIYNLFRKLHVSNRVQAVNWALQNIHGVEEKVR